MTDIKGQKGAELFKCVICDYKCSKNIHLQGIWQLRNIKY